MRLKIHADPNSLPLQKNSRQSVLQMCLTQAPTVGCSHTSLFLMLFSGLCTCPPPRPGSSPSRGQAGLIPASHFCLHSPLHVAHHSPPPTLGRQLTPNLSRTHVTDPLEPSPGSLQGHFPLRSSQTKNLNLAIDHWMACLSLNF